jgi:hypothetical protein
VRSLCDVGSTTFFSVGEQSLLLNVIVIESVVTYRQNNHILPVSYDAFYHYQLTNCMSCTYTPLSVEIHSTLSTSISSSTTVVDRSDDSLRFSEVRIMIRACIYTSIIMKHYKTSRPISEVKLCIWRLVSCYSRQLHDTHCWFLLLSSVTSLIALSYMWSIVYFLQVSYTFRYFHPFIPLLSIAPDSLYDYRSITTIFGKLLLRITVTYQR